MPLFGDSGGNAEQRRDEADHIVDMIEDRNFVPRKLDLNRQNLFFCSGMCSQASIVVKI